MTLGFRLNFPGFFQWVFLRKGTLYSKFGSVAFLLKVAFDFLEISQVLKHRQYVCWWPKSSCFCPDCWDVWQWSYNANTSTTCCPNSGAATCDASSSTSARTLGRWRLWALWAEGSKCSMGLRPPPCTTLQNGSIHGSAWRRSPRQLEASSSSPCRLLYAEETGGVAKSCVRHRWEGTPCRGWDAAIRAGASTSRFRAWNRLQQNLSADILEAIKAVSEKQGNMEQALSQFHSEQRGHLPRF